LPIFDLKWIEMFAGVLKICKERFATFYNSGEEMEEKSEHLSCALCSPLETHHT